MDYQKSIETIIKALELAQKKGCFKIQESAILFQAVSSLINNKPEEKVIIPIDNNKINELYKMIEELKEQKQDLRYKNQDLETEMEGLLNKFNKLEIIPKKNPWDCNVENEEEKDNLD